MPINLKIKPSTYVSLSLIMLVMMTIWGCKSGENYVQPDLNLPATFKSLSSNQSDSTKNDTSNIGKLAWREFFEDSTLLDLIDKGLKITYTYNKFKKKQKLPMKVISNLRQIFYLNLLLF